MPASSWVPWPLKEWRSGGTFTETPGSAHEVGRRKLRVVQALERMGTRGARELLETLGRGPEEAWETRDARQALERMGGR